MSWLKWNIKNVKQFTLDTLVKILVFFTTQPQFAAWRNSKRQECPSYIVSIRPMNKKKFKFYYLFLERFVCCIDSIPEGIAVDSLVRRVFYTDSGRQLIAAMDYNGNNHYVIMNYTQNLDRPRAIVLQPNARYLICKRQWKCYDYKFNLWHLMPI